MSTNDGILSDPDFAEWEANRKAKEVASPHGICPGCDGELWRYEDQGLMVRRCTGCGGIVALAADGLTYDDVSRIVAREFHPDPNAVPEKHRIYYDLFYVGRKGQDRIHGWMDWTTRKILQTG